MITPVDMRLYAWSARTARWGRTHRRRRRRRRRRRGGRGRRSLRRLSGRLEARLRGGGGGGRLAHVRRGRHGRRSGRGRGGGVRGDVRGASAVAVLGRAIRRLRARLPAEVVAVVVRVLRGLVVIVRLGIDHVAGGGRGAVGTRSWGREARRDRWVGAGASRSSSDPWARLERVLARVRLGARAGRGAASRRAGGARRSRTSSSVDSLIAAACLTCRGGGEGVEAGRERGKGADRARRPPPRARNPKAIGLRRGDERWRGRDASAVAPRRAFARVPDVEAYLFGADQARRRRDLRRARDARLVWERRGWRRSLPESFHRPRATAPRAVCTNLYW